MRNRLRRWVRLVPAVALTAPALVCPPAADAAPVTGMPAVRNAASPVTLPTPPMGWNDWNRFHCDITEQIVRQTADAIVRTGLRDAGYRYVNVDDCWEAGSRDAEGRLQSDPAKFPSGIRALAGYVHARGLKFGIYTAVGGQTCQGRPGSGGHYAQDAATFADWGVDYVKFDWCGAQGDPQPLTEQFRTALAGTGRPMALSVSRHGEAWLWKDHPANLWRTSADIDDTWNTMLRNAEEEVGLSGAAGPGHWNDPDMLEVGNGGMSADEYRAHFSLWAVLAAPLLSGTDLRTASQETLAILGNRDVIAVDQDPLSRQGDRLRTDGVREVWTRPLAGGDRAVVLFNRGVYATEIGTSAAEIGLAPAAGYAVRDLWTHRTSISRGGVHAFVPPHGAAMFRIHPLPAGEGAPAGPATLSTSPGFLPAGRTTTVTVSLRQDGAAPVRDVRLGLTGPAGWRIRPVGGAPLVIPPGGARARFAVTVPAGTSPGGAELTATGAYRSLSTATPTTLSAAAHVVVPPPPPSGDGALSAHPRLETDNGWYLPMKVDHSFGPDYCGDCTGGTITLDGRPYATGLGTYASAQVAYYLGGRCSAFEVTTGIDDEVRPDVATMPYDEVGSAVFQIYADGRRVYDSGKRTYATPPGHAVIDVHGVRELTLVDTSAGDGNFFDHADWAGMRIRCATGDR
ncbi:MAG: NPCBM/NEW2 domain-containing protein [Actinoallomurus sp.]